MYRRTFLSIAAAAAPAPVRAFELDEIGIWDLLRGLEQGRWTSRRLVEMYTDRMKDIDTSGPSLRSVIELNPEALAIAGKLDSERRAGHIRGPLHGIPILLKDNIETGDRMATSAGSLVLAGWHAPKDAFVAARLRAAGALILGKTNLSEWANFRSTHAISGWSARGGQTRNPYALRRNPSGSSSGSAVAVAASLCAAAVGTETDGSVVSPASINGIVGVKPTLGLVSRSGIVPIAQSQDTAGPMARSVRDAAMLLTAMAGADPTDAATAGARREDYTRHLDPNGLRGARIGLARKFFEKNAPLDRLLTSCAAMLKSAGAEVIDPADLPSHGKTGDVEFEVLLYEFKAELNAYLSRLPASQPAHALAEVIQFNRKNREREMPWFDQEIFEMAEAKGPLSEKKYEEARQQCLRLTRDEGIDAVCRKHNVQAVAALTSGPAWFIDKVNGDSDTGGCSSPPAIAGYPHITVPAATFRGLPVGLSFFGPAWSEPVLFRLAYAFERVAKARKKPGFPDEA